MLGDEPDVDTSIYRYVVVNNISPTTPTVAVVGALPVDLTESSNA